MECHIFELWIEWLVETLTYMTFKLSVNMTEIEQHSVLIIWQKEAGKERAELRRRMFEKSNRGNYLFLTSIGIIRAKFGQFFLPNYLIWFKKFWAFGIKLGWSKAWRCDGKNSTHFGSIFRWDDLVWKIRG